MKVGIVGLGLIGGSMAKAVKNRTAHTVFGIDLDAETMALSRMSGAIDAPLTEETIPQCDLIMIAIRPGAAIRWVEKNAPLIAKKAILVDLCGVKREVVKAIAPIAAGIASSILPPKASFVISSNTGRKRLPPPDIE